jgi:hypothetical protein
MTCTFSAFDNFETLLSNKYTGPRRIQNDKNFLNLG